MTFVFRNRLDADNGRQIFLPTPPSTVVDTVAELKAALLQPGSYTVLPGTYTADLVANVDNVTIACQTGVVFVPQNITSAAWTISANHFSLTGDWQLNAGANIGINIGDNTATLQSQQPDTVLIEGGTITSPVGGSLRGMACHGSNVTISDCRIEGFYRNGQEAQGIWVNNTNGPFTLIDSFIEGAGENVLFGGDNINIPNAVPSDIYIARNTFYKRPSWRPPNAATVKNLFEFKNAQRAVIEDNVLDGTWKGAQTGNAFVFTVRNSTTAIWDWVIVDDITVRHNIVRNNYEPGSFSVSILGHDDGGRTSEQTRTITIVDNCFEDSVGGVQVNNGVTDLLTMDHNTWPGDISSSLLFFSNASIKTTLSMTNNAGQQGSYGVFANGVSAVAITALNGACNPGYVVTGNVFGRNQSGAVTWPSGNTVVASPGIVFSAPPDSQLTGAQASMDAGWSGPAGVGLNGDGTT